ncbi:hypothetical protein CDIMF43_70025 [Carnobacterium divergens]|nr:hypothetical protein CDIMF43_70025 [Carnobacterium divergens]
MNVFFYCAYFPWAQFFYWLGVSMYEKENVSLSPSDLYCSLSDLGNTSFHWRNSIVYFASAF